MPVLAGVDIVITPGLQELSVFPGFEVYPERLEKHFVLVAVTDKHPVAWHQCVSLVIDRWSIWSRLVEIRSSRRETEHRNFARLLQAHRVAPPQPSRPRRRWHLPQRRWRRHRDLG